MLIDAAIDGQGVALARTTLAAWDLLHGRLVVPIDVSLPAREHLLDRLPETGVPRAQRSSRFGIGCSLRLPRMRVPLRTSAYARQIQ